MTRETSREVVLRAARRLFGERGYSAVTIREVAAEAGVSPSMVMKVVGSKERLYADARPMDPERYDAQRLRPRMGRDLVRRILGRRDADIAEPWSQALYLTLQSPDPEASRRAFRESTLDGFLLLGTDATDPEQRQRAELAACMLIGLAAGARTLRLLDPDTTDVDAVVERYGDLVQAMLDGRGDGPPR